MTDVVWASLITAAGMLGTTITAALAQYFFTRLNLESETARELARIKTESIDRRSEIRYKNIVEHIGKLLIVADPDVSPAVNRSDLARLIVATQMLLDPSIEAEGKLNGALTELGMHCASGDSTARFNASDELIRACQTFVSIHHKT